MHSAKDSRECAVHSRFVLALARATPSHNPICTHTLKRCESEGRSVFDLSLSGPPLAASEGLGPLNKKQKQSDLNAILWPKLLETCGFPSVFHGLWSPNQQCNQPITPSTDSTDPARPLPSTTRSGDRSTAFPPLDPPLALGLAAL